MVATLGEGPTSSPMKKLNGCHFDSDRTAAVDHFLEVSTRDLYAEGGDKAMNLSIAVVPLFKFFSFVKPY